MRACDRALRPRVQPTRETTRPALVAQLLSRRGRAGRVRSGSRRFLATATHVRRAGQPRADEQQGAWFGHRLATRVRWFRIPTRSTAASGWWWSGLLVRRLTHETPAVLRAAGEAEAQCQDQKLQSHRWDSRSHSGRVVIMSNGRAALRRACHDKCTRWQPSDRAADGIATSTRTLQSQSWTRRRRSRHVQSLLV